MLTGLAAAAFVAAALTSCAGGPSSESPDFTACNAVNVAFANQASGGTESAMFTEIGKIGAKTKTPLGKQLSAWAADSQKRIAAGQAPQKSTVFGKSVASQCEADGVLVSDQ